MDVRFNKRMRKSLQVASFGGILAVKGPLPSLEALTEKNGFDMTFHLLDFHGCFMDFYWIFMDVLWILNAFNGFFLWILMDFK